MKIDEILTKTSVFNLSISIYKYVSIMIQYSKGIYVSNISIDTDPTMYVYLLIKILGRVNYVTSRLSVTVISKRNIDLCASVYF